MAQRPGLDQLLTELCLEIASHICSFRITNKDLVHLSTCNRHWRAICTPLIFRRVLFTCYLPNDVLGRFVLHNASRYGYLIKEIDLDAFCLADEDEDMEVSPTVLCRTALLQRTREGGAGMRDEAIASLILLTPNLHSLRVCFIDSRGIGYAVPNTLAKTVSTLYGVPSLRRLVLDGAQLDDVIYQYIAERGHDLEGLVIVGDWKVAGNRAVIRMQDSSEAVLTSLALQNVAFGALFESCVFHHLTHLHLIADMKSFIPAVHAIQSTLRYLSIESIAVQPLPPPLPELTLPRLKFLRLRLYVGNPARESYSFFIRAACTDLIFFAPTPIHEHYLDAFCSLLEDDGFPALQRLSVGTEVTEYNTHAVFVRMEEPNDRFKEVCSRRGIVLAQSAEMALLPDRLSFGRGWF